MDAKIQFLGATNTVTGSKTLLTTPNGLKILIDCGLYQANNTEEMIRVNNNDFDFDVTDIDVCLVSHGHLDHLGGLGILMKKGFHGKIISTDPVGHFASINLKDCAKVMLSDVTRANKTRPKNKLEPLYTMEDAELAISQIRCYDFDTKIELDNDTFVVLKKSGHMLGASTIHITYKEGRKQRTIVFSGDNSGFNSDRPFLPIADKLGSCHILTCESTYGNRIHEKTDVLEILRKSIEETCIQNKKTLLIPSFALQRSSEILWLLREVYMENPQFNKIPIHLDSPMTTKAQRVIDENRSYWGEKWLERDKMLGNLFDWNVINYVEDYKESSTLSAKQPQIIISSSGMLTSGRVLMHLENVLKEKGCKVLITGFQAENTLGRKLLETQHKSISINRNSVVIRAKIEQMNFSSHADLNGLLEWLKSSRRGVLKQIYLNHGDEDAIENFKLEIERHLKGIEVIVPKYRETYKLT